MEPTIANLGRIFKTLRKQQQLTQEKTANRINKSRSYISRIENGKVVPSETQLLDFIEAIGSTKAAYHSMLKTEEYLLREVETADEASNMTASKTNNKEELIHKLSAYFVGSKVSTAYLFGSFSTGLQTDDSDIDILIKFRDEASPTIFDLVSIKLDLEDMLSREVDVVQEESLYEHVKQSMENDKILIYG